MLTKLTLPLKNKRIPYIIYSFCEKKKISAEERKRQLRIKQIKQMEEMNEKFNRTSGKFNSFTSYMDLHSIKFISVGAIFVLGFAIYKIKSTMGFSTDIETGKKKKVMLVSQQYEASISQPIRKMFCNYYAPQLPNIHQQKKLTSLQMQTNLEGILIKSQNPILIFINNSQYLISTALLRQLPIKSMIQLLLVFKYLFQQRLHISQINSSQIKVFWNPTEVENEIKLRQIYTRPYSYQQITKAIQIIQKLKEQQKIKITDINTSDMAQIIELIKNVHDNSTENTKMPQNLWNRVRNYQQQQ